MENESKMSHIEWGLLIGALGTIDLIQIGLDVFLEIGVIANRFIDIFVGMALPFYLHLRGESMSDPKRWIALVATFFAEEIPDVDALPFWCLDGIYYYALWRAKNKVRETTITNPAKNRSAPSDIDKAA